jgi:pilus assembly protein CpaB
MTRSGGLPFVAALALGAVTFASILGWLQQQETGGGSAAPVDLRPVVVASTDVPAGSVLTESVLSVNRVPADALGAGVVQTREAAIGRVLRYPLARGEQVLDSKLVAAEDARTGLAFAIPTGMRAIAVPVSEVTGVGGLIVPGDRVDVLVTAPHERLLAPEDPVPAGNAGQRADVKTILQNALVLAVGQTVNAAVAPAREGAAQRSDDAKPQPKALSVTLAVTPEQAETLLKSSSIGSIGMALRPFADGQDAASASAQTRTATTRTAQ